MYDFNWRAWGLAFVIALGVIFEILKSVPAAKVWESDPLRMPKDKPYAARGYRPGMLGSNGKMPPAMVSPRGMVAPRPAAKPAVVAPTPPPMTKEQLQALLAAHAGKPGETTFGEKKKEGEDEWETVMDPKTGKMVKRKKKKKVAKKDKEKKEEKKEEAKPEPQQVAEDDDHKTDSEADIDSAITNGLKTGQLAPMPKNKADDPFQSAEDWMKLLLSRPNLAETNRFIAHYRQNLVNTETFYKVVNAMIEDNRPEMKKLGIHAAAQTATNSMSFQILATAATNSRNDSSVKAKAEEALNSYTAVNRVVYLKPILDRGTPVAAATKAAQLVKKSAEQNLSTTSSSTGGSNNAQAKKSTYEKFLASLKNLSTTSSDATLKATASETLAALQGLLGDTSTQVAQQQQ